MKLTSKARKSFLQIGALKDLKKELGVRRNSLVKAMIAEVERAIYEDLHSKSHTEAAATSSQHFDRQSSMLRLRIGHLLTPEKLGSKHRSMS